VNNREIRDMSSLLGKITNEISTNTKSNRDLDSIITGFEEILGIRTTQDLLECSNGLFKKLGNSLYGSKEDLYLRTAQKFLILFIYQLREHYSRSEDVPPELTVLFKEYNPHFNRVKHYLKLFYKELFVLIDICEDVKTYQTLLKAGLTIAKVFNNKYYLAILEKAWIHGSIPYIRGEFFLDDIDDENKENHEIYHDQTIFHILRNPPQEKFISICKTILLLFIYYTNTILESIFVFFYVFLPTQTLTFVPIYIAGILIKFRKEAWKWGRITVLIPLKFIESLAISLINVYKNIPSRYKLSLQKSIIISLIFVFIFGFFLIIFNPIFNPLPPKYYNSADPNLTENYILNLYQPDNGGFKNKDNLELASRTQFSGVPTITDTYFGIKTLIYMGYLNMKNGTLDESSIPVGLNISKLLEFIKTCYNTDGGFGITPKNDSDLVSTAMALEILDIFESEYLYQIKDVVTSFLNKLVGDLSLEKIFSDSNDIFGDRVEIYYWGAYIAIEIYDDPGMIGLDKMLNTNKIKIYDRNCYKHLSQEQIAIQDILKIIEQQSTDPESIDFDKLPHLDQFDINQSNNNNQTQDNNSTQNTFYLIDKLSRFSPLMFTPTETENTLKKYYFSLKLVDQLIEDKMQRGLILDLLFDIDILSDIILKTFYQNLKDDFSIRQTSIVVELLSILEGLGKIISDVDIFNNIADLYNPRTGAYSRYAHDEASEASKSYLYNYHDLSGTHTTSNLESTYLAYKIQYDIAEYLGSYNYKYKAIKKEEDKNLVGYEIKKSNHNISTEYNLQMPIIQQSIPPTAQADFTTIY
jgi:hypothetical protein